MEKLTAFETMFLVDNRREYPMTSILRFVFDMALDGERLKIAVRRASAVQPLLNSIVINRRRGQYFWKKTGTDPPVEMGRKAPLNRYFDLEQETGIAVYVFENILEVVWHHAVSDGVGIFGWIRDVLAAYGNLPLRELNPAALSSRSSSRRRRGVKESIRRWTCDMKNSFRLLAARPIALPRATPPDYAFRELAPVELSELQSLARQRDTTLNPVIVAAVYDAIVDYLIAHSLERLSQGHIRIALPINCRSAKDREMPAANKIGYSFVSYPPRGEFFEDVWEADPLWALPEFHSFMRSAMQQRLFEGLWWKLAFLARCSELSLPLNWELLFGLKRCHATAVLTDNGDPTRNWRLPTHAGLIHVGETTLERITGAAPLRPGTELAVSAFTYGGKLRMGLMTSLGLERLNSFRELLLLQYVKMAIASGDA